MVSGPMHWASNIGYAVVFAISAFWYGGLAVVIVLIAWNAGGEWWLRRFRGKGHYAHDYLQSRRKPFLKQQLEAMEARGEFMWRPRSRRD